MAKLKFKADDGWVESFKPEAKQQYSFATQDGDMTVDCYIGRNNVYICSGSEAEATRIPKHEFFKHFKKVKNER